jgi:hypothetical protein
MIECAVYTHGAREILWSRGRALKAIGLALTLGACVGAIQSPPMTLTPCGHSHTAFATCFSTRAPINVLGLSTRSAQSTGIELPKDVREPGAGWYALMGSIRVDLGADVRRGASGEVDVLLDRYAVAQLHLARESVDGQPVIAWSALSGIVGPSAGLVLGTSMRIKYMNYLQVPSVRPGRHHLTVELWEFNGHPVARAALERGASIVRTLAPPKIEIGVRLSQQTVESGDSLTLFYQLDSVGFPARDMGVAVRAPTTGLLMENTPTEYLGWVQSQKRSIKFIALKPGLYRIRISITGSTGGEMCCPERMITLRVRRKER